MGNGEGPTEGEDRPELLSWIRGAESGGVVVEERGALALVRQQRDDRSQGGAFDPLQDGVVTGQHVEVRRLPDVRLESESDQRAEIVVGRLNACRAICACAEPVSPARREAKVAQQRVRGLREVVRNLEGEPAAG